MIEYVKGDILESTAEVIVIPVNTVGVPGAGLAKQTALKYPAWAKDYIEACELLEVGSIHAFDLPNGQELISFPTKRDWRDPSQLDWIFQGLRTLIRHCVTQNRNTIAIPMLGCGKGQLAWSEVRGVIGVFFERSHVTAYVYGE